MHRFLSSARRSGVSLRNFSSTSRSMAAKHEWLVILPDQAGALERRLKVRQEHLKNAQPNVEAGLWKLGGAFFEKPIVEGETPSFAGSVMLAEAASKEEVLETLKKDIYTTSDVWDWDKIQVLPFKSAIRVGL